MSTAQQFPIGKQDKERLQQFLRRRQLNETMVGLLEAAKQHHDLKRGEVTTAKNATYEDIVESIAAALSNEWLTKNSLIEVLDTAEVAGRQHVCLFEVSENDIALVTKSLRTPTTLNECPPELEEFWSIPREPYSRLSYKNQDVLLSKIITPRKYWVELETSIRTEDYIEIKRRREKERAALIVKFTPQTRVIQFRVPIREHAPSQDTATSVYAFIAELVASQYGNTGRDWFLRLRALPICDAFQKIIDNRDDFELHTDTPENNFIKSSMSRKGGPESGGDIRDYDAWVFASGFARSSIRGIWKSPHKSGIEVRMHYEQVKVSQQLTRPLARLYFAKPYSDQELEHVIKRLREHL
jgi:hypothetical protein